MEEQFELVAKTFQGLEEILAMELTQLGANDIQIGRRVVTFTGDKALMYKANFALRTAIRVLKPILHFRATSPDEVYEAVHAMDWSAYMDTDTSFSVDAVVYSEEFRHSKFVAYKVKDAIVDYFREKEGRRPSISITNPDRRFNMHIAGTECTLSLDSSGESLHLRGYRQNQVAAPLNEVLAAGIILLSGWRGECDFIDPMCGSGTLPVEAALIARNIAPGVFRKEYAFEKWPDFDQELFDEIYNDDSDERPFEHKIYGYDIDAKAVAIAQANVKAAGVLRDVTISQRPFEEFTQPAEKSIIVMNPPYGERISSPNLLGLYKTIGERFKKQFVGNEAWVLSLHNECFGEIGLKPSVKIPLYNGSLECELRKYQIFDGKYKDLRQEGGEIKTEDDRRKMADKGRSKNFGSAPRREDDERLFRYRSNDRDLHSWDLRQPGELLDEDDVRVRRFRHKDDPREERHVEGRTFQHREGDRSSGRTGGYSKDRRNRDDRSFHREGRRSDTPREERPRGKFGRERRSYDKMKRDDRREDRHNQRQSNKRQNRHEED